MRSPINIKYPKIIREIINDIKSINKKLNDNTDLAVAIEAKTIATNNKNDIGNLKTQQEENINKFSNILGIANEGNERSKVNTQRLDSIQGKAEAAYNQISRIDNIQGSVNVHQGNIADLQNKVDPSIGNMSAAKTDITNLIDRMDTTEGKANGADQRSLLNSAHIEELYSLSYTNKEAIENSKGDLTVGMSDPKTPMKKGDVEMSYGSLLINVVLKNKRSGKLDYEIYGLIGDKYGKEVINIYNTDGETLLYTKTISFSDYINDSDSEGRYILNIYVDTHIYSHGTFNSDGIFEVKSNSEAIYVEVKHLKLAK